MSFGDAEQRIDDAFRWLKANLHRYSERASVELIPYDMGSVLRVVYTPDGTHAPVCPLIIGVQRGVTLGMVPAFLLDMFVTATGAVVLLHTLDEVARFLDNLDFTKGVVIRPPAHRRTGATFTSHAGGTWNT